MQLKKGVTSKCLPQASHHVTCSMAIETPLSSFLIEMSDKHFYSAKEIYRKH
jgi:hypothetical protein